MNDIQIFKSPQFGKIRTAVGKEGEPLFCLIDVAKALKYKYPADAVSSHCKGVVILPTPTKGGVQQIKFGKEGDIYRLVMKSKLPEAGAFQDWVCDEVLPAIRKHGAYATPVTIDSMIADPDFAIRLLTNLKEERQQRLLAEQKNERQQELIEAQGKTIATMNEQIVELNAKNSYLDTILRSKSTVTTTQIAADYGMSAKKFNALLRSLSRSSTRLADNGSCMPHTTPGVTSTPTPSYPRHRRQAA